MQLQGRWKVKQLANQPLIVVNSIVLTNFILNKMVKFVAHTAVIIKVKTAEIKNGTVDLFTMTCKYAVVKEMEQTPDTQIGNWFQKIQNNGWINQPKLIPDIMVGIKEHISTLFGNVDIT